MLVKTRGTSSKGFLKVPWFTNAAYSEMQDLNLLIVCIKYQLGLCK